MLYLVMLVINLFGGAGVGKSTTSAEIFVELKKRGYVAELVTEYAKQLTWDERVNILANDQIYIFAKQQRALNRLKGKVDFVVTDAPLLHSNIYAPDGTSKSFLKLVHDTFSSFDNYNVFISRRTEYKTDGRMQTLNEAMELDTKIQRELQDNNYPYRIWSGPQMFKYHQQRIIDDIVGSL